MMNNLTPSVQSVLELARKEADRLNHNYVGTEHLLMGMIELGQNGAIDALRRKGIGPEMLQVAIDKEVGRGPDIKMVGNIPYTPRVKKVMAIASLKAKALGDTLVDTEHLLLALLQPEDGGAAYRILTKLGMSHDVMTPTIISVMAEKTREESLGDNPDFKAMYETEHRLRLLAEARAKEVKAKFNAFANAFGRFDKNFHEVCQIAGVIKNIVTQETGLQ